MMRQKLFGWSLVLTGSSLICTANGWVFPAIALAGAGTALWIAGFCAVPPVIELEEDERRAQ